MSIMNTVLRRAGRVTRRRAVALGAALVLCWATLPRPPASARFERPFPAVQPHALAHYLADFSNHVLLDPAVESWAVEAEWSNVTAWRYEVSYTCGARCAGRAAVTALATGELRHGDAPLHRVLALDARCTGLLPLLPWPTLCEEIETESRITSAGESQAGGSLLVESALARCSRLAALLGRCAGDTDLAAGRQLRLRAMSAALGA